MERFAMVDIRQSQENPERVKQTSGLSFGYFAGDLDPRSSTMVYGPLCKA